MTTEEKHIATATDTTTTVPLVFIYQPVSTDVIQV